MLRAKRRPRTAKGTAAPAGSLPRLALTRRPGRDAVLVVANEPLRTSLASYCHDAGFEALTAATPLDAVHALEACEAKIAYAVTTSELAWSRELRELLADEYPAIERIAVIV